MADASVPNHLRAAGAINQSTHTTLAGPNLANKLSRGDVLPAHEQFVKNPSATTLNNGTAGISGNNGLVVEKGRPVEENDMKTLAALKAETIEPHLSVWSGTGLVIGLMIGSGIFATPGKVIVAVGNVGTALLLWVAGGIIVFFGTFSYIEMGTMLPLSGGEQAYLDVAFQNPRAMLSFLFCWSSILCIRPGSIAAEASVIGRYVLFAYFGSDIGNPNTARYIGLGCVALIAIITAISSRLAIRIHDCFVVIKVLTLLLISITGIVVACGQGHIVPLSGNFNDAWSGAPASGGGAYAHALFQIFWSYDGWNNLNYATAELINPKRSLPLAATTGITVVTILYILTNVSYIIVVPLSTILQGNVVLAAQWGTAVFGPIFGGRILPALIAVSTFGAAMANTFGGSRVLHVTARAGYLPFSRTIGHLNKLTHTPANAILINFGLVVILLMAPPVGPIFDFLVDLVGYPAWVFYTLSVIGCIVMRKTMATYFRPFKTWLPLCYVFILAGIFQFVMPFVPYGTADYVFWLPPIVGWAFMISGIPAYFAFVHWKKDASLDLQYSIIN